MFKEPFLLESLRMVQRVLYYNARVLLSAFLVCFTMMIACAIALYYTRPPAHIVGFQMDNYDKSASILSCLYLAVLMLTGQGIPDGVMPWYSRIVIAITALFAIAQFAIPASMLTWGFENEAERNICKHAERERKVAAAVRRGQGCPESSSSSGESDRAEEWTGYLEQLAGSGDESSESSKEGSQPVRKKTSAENVLATGGLEHDLTAPELRRATKIFLKMDADNDGFISVEKLRGVSDSDEDAKDLLEEINSFRQEGEKATLLEFILWLSHIKTKYQRYGNKVLLRLLHKMESMLFMTLDRSRWNLAASAKKTQTVSFAQQSKSRLAKASTSHRQLILLSDRYGELENNNAGLVQKIKDLEATLAALKAE